MAYQRVKYNAAARAKPERATGAFAPRGMFGDFITNSRAGLNNLALPVNVLKHIDGLRRLPYL